MEPHEASAPSDPLAAQLGWVRELARALLGNSADADDVAQEVWLRASSNPAARDRAWLSVVTTRLVQGARRSEARRRRREEVAARTEARSPDDVLARGETSRRLIGAVMTLPEPYRSTVLHRYIDGLGVREIAERKNVTEAAVRKRLSRALGRLRTQLDEEFEGGRRAWIAALIDVAGRGRPTALPWFGAAGVGFVLMKKALVVAAALALICLSIFSATGRSWLGLEPGREPAALVATIVGTPRTDPALGQPEPHIETRASVAPAASSPTHTLVVEGVVKNLPFPETPGATEPAAGVVVSLSFPMLEGAPIPELETTTDAAGRYRLSIENPGQRALYLNLSVEGDEHYRSEGETITLEDRTGPFELDLERVAHGDLSGLVIDDADQPIADILVRLEQSSAWGLGEDTEEGVAPAPRNEATTDARGRFTFHNVHTANGFYPGTPVLVVHKDGYRVMPSKPPSFRARGGWDEVEIRLLPSAGQVVVRVVDAHGEPQSGMRVSAQISNGEPGASFEPWDEFPRQAQKTDADGRVVLDDLWIGRRLQLSLQSKSGNWSFERATGGRVDLGRAARGGAIVIPESKSLALEVVLPPTNRISGRVVDSGGKPVPGAHVHLHMRGGDTRPDNRFALESDSEGRVETVIARPDRVLVIDVGAYTGKASSWASLVDLWPEPGRLVGRSVVEFDPAARVDPFFEIVIRPALAISGSVRDADGTPCKGMIVAIPVGAPEGAYSRGAGSPIEEDGRFEIGALVPGEYVLDLRPKKHQIFTDCLLTQRFEGIEAGRSDVHLVLVEDRAVDVEIEVSAADGTPTEMTFVIGMFHPYVARDPSGHVPDAKQKYDGLSGWPSGATLNFGGQTGHVGPDGVTGFLHVYGKLPLHRLAPMSEGWYTLGLDARDANGTRYHACGTGLVYLKPGAYRFHFDLVRESLIEGVITNFDPEVDLALMLVTPDGKPISVQRTSRTLDEVVSIGAAGRFRIEGAPVGEYRLRVGSEPELRRGSFVTEVDLTIGAKDNAPLRLTLP